MESNFQVCPDCLSDDIPSEARKCKHCGSLLDPKEREEEAKKEDARAQGQRSLGIAVSIIVFILIFYFFFGGCVMF